MIAVAYLSWATLDKSAPAVFEDYLTEKLGFRAGSTAPTVTIMPFEPLSDQLQHAYLARSIVADLTTNLRGLRACRWSVPPQSPTRRSGRGTAFWRSLCGVRQLAAVGDQLKVNVRLTDTQTGQTFGRNGMNDRSKISLPPRKRWSRDWLPPFVLR